MSDTTHFREQSPMRLFREKTPPVHKNSVGYNSQQNGGYNYQNGGGHTIQQNGVHNSNTSLYQNNYHNESGHHRGINGHSYNNADILAKNGVATDFQTLIRNTYRGETINNNHNSYGRSCSVNTNNNNNNNSKFGTARRTSSMPRDEFQHSPTGGVQGGMQTPTTPSSPNVASKISTFDFTRNRLQRSVSNNETLQFFAMELN